MPFIFDALDVYFKETAWNALYFDKVMITFSLHLSVIRSLHLYHDAVRWNQKKLNEAK